MTTLIVRCSCGRETTIRTDAEGRFSCDNPDWRYDGIQGEERLWHCGKAGHYQAGVFAWSEARPAAKCGEV